MKTKIKEISGSRRIFEIEVPPETILAKYEEVYGEIQRQAQIAGFRPGKAPRHLIEAQYQGTASEEVKKRLISDHFIKAVSENKLDMIGSPLITDVVFEANKPLTFKAEINIRPEVKLKSYKGLKVNKEKVCVSTEDVDKVIEDLQERAAQLKDIEGRCAKEGDWCLCDVEISVEGKPGKKNEGVWFPLTSKSTKPEFLEQLVGANRGDTKTVKTTLPANYNDKEQAGKEAIFIVTVNQIKEKILPAINDDFAKEIGGFKSLLELRGNIRDELTKSKEEEVRLKTEEEILNQLIKATDFEAPAIMVESETQRLSKDMHSRLQYMGYKKEDIEKEEPVLKEKLKDEAVKKVKSFFILEKVAELEGITPTDEELDKRIGLLAQRSKRSAEDMKGYLVENDLLEDIKADIVQDKALEFLVANAIVTEKA